MRLDRVGLPVYMTLFTPVEHTDGALRNEFYKEVLDKDAAQVKAI